MSKLQHVEGIGLIDLSAITFVSECGNPHSFHYIVDGVKCSSSNPNGKEVYDNLIKAIEEHDKFFYGSIEQ